MSFFGPLPEPPPAPSIPSQPPWAAPPHIFVVCRWLEHDIPETQSRIDAAALADARARSRQIWT